ncbi:MAG: transposase [bacterium]|nr:transposase [bacterium]
MATRRSPRHSLTDAQWDLISDLFQVEYCGTGRRPRDRRVIMNAIFWVLRTGAPWRDLPAEFGPWSTPWDFFDKWNKDGTFDKVLRRLRSNAIPDRAGRDDLWCIDGTSIRDSSASLSRDFVLVLVLAKRPRSRARARTHATIVRFCRYMRHV